jgi:hypothetical protein
MRALTTGALCTLSLTISMSMAPPAWSQQKVGVATTVVGPVTVTRAALPAAPLKFKDDIFLRDRVTTGDDAITRILLGGKVIVTARERSTLTITEVPGLSTIDLASGRIAVAVDKTRMKSGERVEVRTPNAIAGVRGTVFIVEAQPNISTVTVLRGLVDVSRLDPNAHVAVGPVTPVAKHHTITVRNNVLPAHPTAITPAQADALSREFTPPMRQVAAAIPVEDEVQKAKALLSALLPQDDESDRQGSTASGSMNPEAEATPGVQPVDSGRAAVSPGITPATSLVSGAGATLSNTTNTLADTTGLLTNTTNTLVGTTTGLLTNTTNTLVGATTGLLTNTTNTLVGTTTDLLAGTTGLLTNTTTNLVGGTTGLLTNTTTNLVGGTTGLLTNTTNTLTGATSTLIPTTTTTLGSTTTNLLSSPTATTLAPTAPTTSSAPLGGLLKPLGGLLK